ncbi:MAG: sulfite oxidase, partial [Nocardioidaceae bacterium]
MWDKRDDMVVHESEPYNAEPCRHALAVGQLTPVDTFYARNHGPVPQVEAAAWRLQVDGLVDRPLQLTIADLRSRFVERSLVATLQCAGNRRAALSEFREVVGEDQWGPCAISTASWTGVRLADVLEEAGVDPEAAHVAFEAPDVSELADPPAPYAGSVPLAKVASGEVLLAWAMNGQELPPVHGGPLRVVVPGYIGARSVKWVRRVDVRRDPSDGFFQATAYRMLPVGGQPAPGAGFCLGPVALNSDVLEPADGSSVPAGRLTARGYAHVGDGRGVARVDVSIDNGATWVEADLDDRVDPWAWRLWSCELDLPPGAVTVTVRAWDTTGATQPALPAHVWNPKGYANTSWGRASLLVGG